MLQVTELLDEAIELVKLGQKGKSIIREAGKGLILKGLKVFFEITARLQGNHLNQVLQSFSLTSATIIAVRMASRLNSCRLTTKVPLASIGGYA